MAFSTPEDIIAFVSLAVPGFKPGGEVEELSGGNLNYVWRVFGEGQSVVVKQAPPYIAKAPDIPISPQRILIEATALRLFEQPPLHRLFLEHLRPPRLIHADEKQYAIVLEDVGNLESLDKLRATGESLVRLERNNGRIRQPLNAGFQYHNITRYLVPLSLGSKLGTFIGQLHRFTCQNEAIAKAIDNRPIQQSRLEVQYAQIGRLLKDFGISSWAELGHKAEKLGEKYLTKGKCLIMGDLWPRSVLIGPEEGQARIIDWEFAHYGRPAQDVAHFMAHLWMLQHRAGSVEAQLGFQRMQEAFFSSYNLALGAEKPLLFGEEEMEDAGIHFGAEILVRTIGSFQGGYLYEDLSPDHPKIQEAVAVAVRYMSGAGGLTSFAWSSL